MIKQLLWFAMVLAITFSMKIAENQTTELNSTQLDNLEGLKYQCSYLENNRIFSYKVVKDKLEVNKFVAPVIADKTIDIYFSFCDDTQVDCSNIKQEDLKGSAILKDEITGTCTRISSSKWEDATVALVSSPAGWKDDYLSLTWNGLDDCPFGATTGQKWQFTVDIV